MAIPVFDVTGKINELPRVTRGIYPAQTDAEAIAYFSKMSPAPVAIYKIRKDYFAEFQTLEMEAQNDNRFEINQ